MRCDEMRRFVSFRLILFRARQIYWRIEQQQRKQHDDKEDEDVDDISQETNITREQKIKTDNKNQHARIEIHT